MEQDALLTVCRQNHSLWQNLKNNPLHYRILNFSNYTDFRGILEVRHIRCYSEIITTLIERWSETHTFHLRIDKATIIMQNMKVMFGMVVNGTPILLEGIKILNLISD